MSSYWCELAWLGGERAEAGVLVEIAGERIQSVTAGAAPPPAAERLDGLTVPGLANAHSHAFQRALRGRAQERGEGSFWTWRERMYELAERIDPDGYLALARACFAEMALAGITAVGEFHYLHHRPGGAPYEDPNALGAAVIAAAREAGLRITLLDTCYLHGGFGEPAGPEQQRFRDRDAAAWAERVDAIPEGPDVRVGAAIHSVRAVDPESAGLVAGWAAGRERPLHAHLSEQPAENEAALRAHGLTPTAILAGAGALETRFTAVHATHLSDEDVAHARRLRRLLLPLPDHRTRPRRRDRRRPPAARRRLLARARQRLAGLHRSVRGGAGGRARPAPGERPARAALGGRAARRRLRRTATRASAGTTAAGSRRGCAPTSSRSRSTGRGWPGPPPPPRSSRSSSRRPPPTSAG